MSPEEIGRVLEQSDAEHRRRVQERLEEIRRAETADPGKERFSVVRLGELYDLAGDDGVLRPDPNRDLLLEHRYWTRHPETKTVEAFARALHAITASGES